MATPALTSYGSEDFGDELLEAEHYGRICRLHRRVRGRLRLRRRLDQDHREEGRRRLRHQGRQDVDHQRHAGRLDVPARQHEGRPGPPQQVAHLPADEDKGVDIVRKLDKLGSVVPDTAQIDFDNVRVPQRNLIGEEGSGLHLSDAPIPGKRPWAAAAGADEDGVDIRMTIKSTAGAGGFRQEHPRRSGGALPPRRTGRSKVEPSRSLVDRAVRKTSTARTSRGSPRWRS